MNLQISKRLRMICASTLIVALSITAIWWTRQSEPGIEIPATQIQPRLKLLLQFVVGSKAPGREQGQKISASDSVVGSILDPQIPGSERRHLLQTIIESKEPSLSALSQIAASALPATRVERINQFERGLRITALESLDRLAMHQRPQIVASELRVILEKQRDPMLQFMANLSLSGIENGTPGQLTRVMDRLLKL